MSGLSETVGICLLKKSYTVCLQSVSWSTGQSEVSVCSCSSRISLPSSFECGKCVSWTSKVGDSLPSALPPMAISDEEKIVTVLTAELISKFAFNLGQKISFNHSPDAFGNKLPSCSPDHLLLVDSSHSKYICRYLDMANISFANVSIPNWQVSAAKAADMAEAVKKRVAEIPPDSQAVVVFQLLDNSMYMARTEEGALIPCSKEGESSRYDVDGDLMLAPRELVKNMINMCTPILRAADGLPKLMLVPLPRYTKNSCCSDSDHGANTREAGFKSQLLSDLDQLKKSIKDMCFTANIRNIRTVNLGNLVESDPAHWGADPVHPNPDCYGKIANRILEEVSLLLQANKSPAYSNPSATERVMKRSASSSPANNDMSGCKRATPALSDNSSYHHPVSMRGRGRGRVSGNVSTWRGNRGGGFHPIGRVYGGRRSRWSRVPVHHQW